jgi:anti-anti-sigma regulatory factor
MADSKPAFINPFAEDKPEFVNPFAESKPEFINPFAVSPTPATKVCPDGTEVGVNETCPEPVDQSFLRSVADVPLQIGKGATYGVRAITEAFGADNPVAENLRGIEDFLDNLLSAQSKADSAEISRLMKEAEDGGFAEQVGAAIKGISIAPIDFMANAVGTVIPAAAAGLLAGPGLAGTVAAVGTGAVMGSGVVKGAIFETIEEELLKAGVTPEQAEAGAKEAQAYGGENLDQIALGTVLGGWAAKSGLEPALAKLVTGNVAKRGVLKGAVTEAVPEAFQGAQEQLARNLAQIRDERLPDVPAMRGVVGAGTLEGLAGGLAGAGVGAVSNRGAVDPNAKLQAELQSDIMGRAEKLMEADSTLTESEAVKQAAEDLKQSDLFDAPTEFGAPDGVGGFTEAGRLNMLDRLAAATAQEITSIAETIVNEKITGEQLNAYVQYVASPENGLGGEDGEAFLEVELARLNNLGSPETDAEGKPVTLNVKQDKPNVEDVEIGDDSEISLEDSSPPIGDESGIDLEDSSPPVGDLDIAEEPTLEEQITDFIVENKGATISEIQRNFKIGFNPTSNAVENIPNLVQNVETGSWNFELSPKNKPGRPKEVKTEAGIAQTKQNRKVSQNKSQTIARQISNLTKLANKSEQQLTLEGIKRAVGQAAKNTALKKIKTIEDYQELQNTVTRLQEELNAFPAVDAAPELELDEDLPKNLRAKIDTETAPVSQESQRAELNRQIIDLRKIEKGIEKIAEENAAERAKRLVQAIDVLRNPNYKNNTTTRDKAQKLIGSGLFTDLELKNAHAEHARNTVKKKSTPSKSFVDFTSGEINPVLVAEDVTTDSALSSIIKNGTKFERLLARRLLPFVRNTKLVIVRDVDALDTITAADFRSGANGTYDDSTNTIHLLSLGESTDGTTNTTFLHEAVHAATINLIGRSIDNPDSVPDTTNQLREELIEQMYEAELKYIVDKQNGKNNPMLDLIVERGDIFGDVTEFVAYGITQPEMQEFLLTVPPTTTREGSVAATGLSKFINIIRKLFGMGENTDNGFVSLLDLTDQLIGLNEAAKRVPLNIVKQSRSKAKKITAVANKLQRSKTATALANNLAKSIIETRDENTATDLVSTLARAGKTKGLRKLVKTFTTAGLTRTLVNDFEIDSVREVNNTVGDMAIERARRIKELAEEIPTWEKFNSKYVKGGEILSDVMHMATLSNFDPGKHKNLQAALRNDLILNNTNKDNLGLRQVYQKLRVDPNASVQQVNAAKGAITQRENKIREIYTGSPNKDGVIIGGWNRLQETENGGQEGVNIYKRARDAYKKNFDEHQALLVAKINNKKPKDGKAFTQQEIDDKKKLLAYIVETYQRANEMEVYFPLMRYGDFFLKVGAGKGRAREFYMFESEVARDIFARQRAKEINPNLTLEQQIKDGDLERGENGMDSMRTEIRESSDMLKQVFNLLETNEFTDTESVKDSVYQLYLMTLPESDIRKRFTRRKGITGFSSDALRNFVVTQNTGANQLTRLKYADRLQTAISAMDDSLQGNPDGDIIKIYTNEIAERAQQESTPNQDHGILDKLAASGNSVVFYWMLSAPKSAIIQFTQLPIVGLPVLSAEFGGAATTKVMAKYMANVTTNQGFGIKEQVSTDSDGNAVYKYKEPSLSRGNYLQKNADPEMRGALQEAFEYAAARDLFMSTYAADVTSRARVPSAKRNNALSKALRFGADFMSGSFHHAERMNREIMYLSSFELAYADAKKRGLDKDEAQQEAQARAVELTYEGLFNYTNYNKPSLMKANPLTRLGTQFMTFPLQMTSLLTRNFLRGILDAKVMGMSKTDRLEAAGIFTGVLGMTWLFAGAVGLPMFSALGSVIDEAKELYKGLFDDEDDLDADLFSFGNLPFDVWFRAVFIPRYFGVDSDIAEALDLSEENAQLLARVVEAGPLSALTDMNIGASTSLDGMWFRNDSPQAGYEEQVKDFMYETMFGPFGSLGSNIARGVEDLERGNYLRAMENFLPAMFRNVAKAERLKQEGLLTRSGAEIKPAEYYTARKLFAQQLGFAATEPASRQQLAFKVKQIVAEQATQKANVLTDLDAAVTKYNRDPSPQNYARVQRVNDQINKYNIKYFYNMINSQTIEDSLKGRAERRGAAVDGLYVTDKLQPLVFPLLRPELQNN